MISWVKPQFPSNDLLLMHKVGLQGTDIVVHIRGTGGAPRDA